MENKVTSEQIERIIKDGTLEVQTLGDKTTLVKFTTKEGFVIVATSSCVSPENYDKKIGEELCMRDIKDKLWEFEGYRLQKELCETKAETAKERVEKEASELESRATSLNGFIGTPKFNNLNDAAKDYLIRQRDVMWQYLVILRCRLSIWEDEA